MIRDIQEIQSLATKYSKQQLAQMAQMGMLDPTKAVMAGMMIKRIEEQNQKPPQTTVAQDVLGAPQQMPMQGQQQPQQPPQQQQMAQAPAGIEGLPAGEVGNYAGGGIVAFGVGGDVDDHEYYGLPFGGRSGSEEYWARPVMPYGEQMRNLGSSLWRGTKNLLSIPDTEVTPTSKEKGKTTESKTAVSADEMNRYIQANKDAKAALSMTSNPLASPASQIARDAGSRLPATSVSRKAAETSTLPAFDPSAVKLTAPEYTKPKLESLDEILKSEKEVEEKVGYNPNLTAEQIKRVEGKKGELDSRKERAGGEALFNFGLGLLGAKRGQEFETAGKSGQAALGAYKNDVKELQAAQDKYDERVEALRVADNEAKRTKSAAAIAKRDRQQDKVDAAELEVFKANSDLAKTGALVSANVYGTTVGAQTAREGHQTQLQVANIQAQTSREYTSSLRAQGLQDSQIKNIMGTASEIYKAALAKNPTADETVVWNAALKQASQGYAQIAPMVGKTMPTGVAAPMEAPTADFYKKTFGITPTR